MVLLQRISTVSRTNISWRKDKYLLADRKIGLSSIAHVLSNALQGTGVAGLCSTIRMSATAGNTTFSDKKWVRAFLVRTCLLYDAYSNRQHRAWMVLEARHCPQRNDREGRSETRAGEYTVSKYVCHGP